MDPKNQDIDYVADTSTGIIEEYKPKDVSDHVKKLYDGDIRNLMSLILQLYKFIIEEMPDTEEIPDTEDKKKKNYEDIDINFDMNKLYQKAYKDTVDKNIKNILVNKKIDTIPDLLDFCFIYYIHKHDDRAPFYEAPLHEMRFQFICKTMNLGKDKINKSFLDLINNPLIHDMRTKKPYYLTTEIDYKELDKKIIHTIAPLFKVLISYLVTI
jgi:hypothetical protein